MKCKSYIQEKIINSITFQGQMLLFCLFGWVEVKAYTIFESDATPDKRNLHKVCTN